MNLRYELVDYIRLVEIINFYLYWNNTKTASSEPITDFQFRLTSGSCVDLLPIGQQMSKFYIINQKT